MKTEPQPTTATPLQPESVASEPSEAPVRVQRMVSQLRDALLANQIFHTPIALRRRGGKWDEYEIDAINRTREGLAATEWLANSGITDAGAVKQQ